MSEYQFYQFQTIDRPLSAEQRKAVSNLSSRGSVTGSSATYVYHYSDFRHDPLDVLGKYFDIMFYMSNWGSRRLILKIPEDLFDDLIRDYGSETLEIFDFKNSVIIDLHIENEDHDDWLEGEGILNSLVQLRSDMIAGDYRSLYLLWLQTAIRDEYEDLTEPEVPAGLNELSGALNEFVEVFMIDRDMVAVAARESEPLRKKETIDFSGSFREMSTADKDEWLLRLAKNEPLLSQKLTRYLAGRVSHQATANRRTVEEIKELMAVERQNRVNKETRKKEAERLAELKRIESREPWLWKDVYGLIGQKKTKAYDEAVKILKSLKALAIHKGAESTFNQKLLDIRTQNKRLSGLIGRLDHAGLY